MPCVDESVKSYLRINFSSKEIIFLSAHKHNVQNGFGSPFGRCSYRLCVVCSASMYIDVTVMTNLWHVISLLYNVFKKVNK